LLDRIGDEFGAVIAADAFRYAVHRKQFRQAIDHILTRHPSTDVERDASPCVLVHDRQPLQRLTVGRAIEDKIPSPNVIHTLRSQAITGVAGFPSCSLFLLLFTHLQPFRLPDSMDTLEAHAKSLQPEQSRHLTIAEPGTLAGKGTQTLANGSCVALLTTTVTDAGS